MGPYQHPQPKFKHDHLFAVLQLYSLNLQMCETEDSIGLFVKYFIVLIQKKYPNTAIFIWECQHYVLKFKLGAISRYLIGSSQVDPGPDSIKLTER